jgi:hypothetical protein
MKEAEVTKAILNELKSTGVFTWKYWSGAFSKKGVSDILGVLPDRRFLAIEFKGPDGRVTAH